MNLRYKVGLSFLANRHFVFSIASVFERSRSSLPSSMIFIRAIYSACWEMIGLR